MPRVRNVSTGLTWDVPEGHHSLSSAEYVVLVEPAEPEAAPETEPEPELRSVRVPKARPKKG